MALEIFGVTLRPGDDPISSAYLDYPQPGPVHHRGEGCSPGWMPTRDRGNTQYAAALIGIHCDHAANHRHQPRPIRQHLADEMLAEHPAIVVRERFPYEQRVCSYWMHLVKVLATPVDTSQAESFGFWTDRKRFIPFPSFFLDPVFAGSVGANVDRWYASKQVEEFAPVAQATVESFYREHARG